ncbi:choloylglycine hydrolase family protein [Vagococcus humatus]|uniref:Penicillin acylase n=1 Tax=Vagococcus humatus TaxID=1889241 RepID=A0A3R9YKC3_9ENTE|nr:choloylglycine hydrolase family protein [Vagococcus humatus]RST89711.1 penicillin acylase [Vagococcus humatus]
MCTSLTLTTKNQHHFLGRTMDFGFQLYGKPVVIPRNHSWQLQLGTKLTTRWGFVGTGRNLGEYFVADGINEKGLAVAELYFLGEAHYVETPDPNKLSVAPHELISWLLGEVASIAELREKLTDVQLVHAENPLLQTVVPLHFIVTDKTGECVVLETDKGYLEIKDNPVGVMANSPELEWHLKNLTNYLGIRPTNFSNKTMGTLEIKPFGQGSGTFGLPGGFTSPERFVRTVYNREFTETGETLTEGVNALLQILNNVTIPKGVNLKDDGSTDYTQYRAVMETQSLTYYFQPYETPEVFSLQLTEDLLTAAKPVEFPVNTEFKVTSLTK